MSSDFKTSPSRLPIQLSNSITNNENKGVTHFESYKDEAGDAASDPKQMSTEIKNLGSSKFDSISFNVDQHSQGQHMSRYSHFHLKEYDGHASTIIKKSDSN